MLHAIDEQDEQKKDQGRPEEEPPPGDGDEGVDDGCGK